MAASAACPLYLIASRKHKGLKYHHGAVEIASSGWICRPNHPPPCRFKNKTNDYGMSCSALLTAA